MIEESAVEEQTTFQFVLNEKEIEDFVQTQLKETKIRGNSFDTKVSIVTNTLFQIENGLCVPSAFQVSRE